MFLICFPAFEKVLEEPDNFVKKRYLHDIFNFSIFLCRI
jgi:hypothetical protein